MFKIIKTHNQFLNKVDMRSSYGKEMKVIDCAL